MSCITVLFWRALKICRSSITHFNFLPPNYIRKHYLDGRISEKIFQDHQDLLNQYPINWSKMRNDQELKRLLTYVIGAGNSEKRWQSGTLSRAKDLIGVINNELSLYSN